MSNSLSSTISHALSWTMQQTLTGTDYQPITVPGNLNKKQALGSTSGNATLGGANQLISYVFTIAGSGSATVNLQSLTNILQQTGVSLARVKGWLIRLLSPTDDATNGTACASITVGNASTFGFAFNMGAASMTFNIKNGGSNSYLDQSLTGFGVDSTHLNVKVQNMDSISAAVQLSFVGGDT